MMNQTRSENTLLGVAVAGLATAAITALVGGCSSNTGKASQPFLDAGQTGKVDMTRAITLAMPDGFNNVAAKCIGHNGLYVTYHGDSPYGSITVVPADPNCESGVYVDPAAH